MASSDVPTASKPRRTIAAVLVPHAGGRFASLDGFRAIAAFGVVVYHIAGTSGLTRDKDGGLVAAMLGNLGNFGVAVFFLLSGFLLYRPFVIAHFDSAPAPKWRTFYWNRCLRIFPGYWLALTLFLLLVGTANASPKLDYYVTLYTLTQNYRPYFGAAGLSVAWTLCIEVSFYVALPLLAAGIRHGLGRTAKSHRAKCQAQVLGLGIMVVVGWLYRLTIVPLSTGPEDNQHLWLPNYFDWFALGMVMAVAVTWGDLGHRLPRVLRVLANTPWVCWVLAGWTYGILAVLRSGNVASLIGSEKESVSEVFVRFLFNGLAALFLLLPGIVGTTRQSPIRRALGTMVPAFLGTISYGVYLWHKLWLDWLKNGGRKEGLAGGFGSMGQSVRDALGGLRDSLQSAIGNGFWVLLASVLVLTVTTASLSWFGFERPLLRFKRSSGPQ